MFDWLISGGASLISGLLGMGSEKARDKENAKRVREANERNEKRVQDMNADVRARADAAANLPIIVNQQGGVNVSEMMKGAEAAGFNPVTWLRNGAMAAYSTTSQQTWNSHAMDAALAGSEIFQESAPAMSTARGPGEVLGSALQTGASAWVAEAQQQRQDSFQLALMDMQLQGANRAGNVGPRSGYVPTAFLGGNGATSSGSAVLSSNPGWSGVNAPPGWMNTDTDKLSPRYGGAEAVEGWGMYLRERLLPGIMHDIGMPASAADEFQPVTDYWNKTVKPWWSKQMPALGGITAPPGYSRPSDWSEPIL